jgi:hypothetical protein
MFFLGAAGKEVGNEASNASAPSADAPLLENKYDTVQTEAMLCLLIGCTTRVLSFCESAALVADLDVPSITRLSHSCQPYAPERGESQLVIVSCALQVALLMT